MSDTSFLYAAKCTAILGKPHKVELPVQVIGFSFSGQLQVYFSYVVSFVSTYWSKQIVTLF